MIKPVVLSLGGGLDSWVMLLEAVRRSERIDVVAFIDVGHPDDPGEWPSTYRHVEEVVRPFCAEHGIEFVKIDSSNFPVRDARSLFAWFEARKQIPVAGNNRICTRIAKVERFEAWLDSRFPGQEVDVWIGFEAGEEARAAKDPNAGAPRSPSRTAQLSLRSVRIKDELPRVLHNSFLWARALAFAMSTARRANRFPLIEWGLCRCRCEKIARASGKPVPRKSACVFCPYASKGDWQRFAVDIPAGPTGFARVVKLEADKPLTAENQLKLTIMAFSSKKHAGKLLPDFVRGSYTRSAKPCKVCGAAARATKATGCDYLPEAA